MPFSRSIAAVAVPLFVAVAWGARSSAQQPAAPDTTTALLNEVRALRLAIERTNAVAPRVQLTLARLNIEEQRVTQLSAQLDKVRQELSQASTGAQHTTDRLADIERELQTATDEKVRRQLDEERRAMTSVLRLNAVQLEQLRVRETDGAQALSTEQNRWIDLNSKLDELERLLGPVR